MKTALVAAVAGMTMFGWAGAASAAPVTGTPGGVGGALFVAVHGTAPEADESSFKASMLELESDGQHPIVYCIDLTHGLGGDTYEEEDWDTSGVANLNKIKWVLIHSFPNVEPDAVLSAAGASLPDTYSDDEVAAFVYAATQASIWHLSDEFQLDATDTTDKGQDVDAAVRKIYDYLTTSATDEQPPTANVAFDGPGGSTGQVGDVIGPFTVQTNVESLTLSVTGGEIVDADGNPITDLEVTEGDQFYLTSDQPGTVTVTGAGDVNVPVGRIFVSQDNPDTEQKIILAGGLNSHGEAQVSVNFQVTPTESSASPSPSESGPSSEVPTTPVETTTTPAGGLPVTGSSLTIMGIVGAALLAGGVVLVLFMRRRRAAAATWGSDEDGLV